MVGSGFCMMQWAHAQIVFVAELFKFSESGVGGVQIPLRECRRVRLGHPQHQFIAGPFENLVDLIAKNLKVD